MPEAPWLPGVTSTPQGNAHGPLPPPPSTPDTALIQGGRRILGLLLCLPGRRSHTAPLTRSQPQGAQKPAVGLLASPPAAAQAEGFHLSRLDGRILPPHPCVFVPSKRPWQDPDPSPSWTDGFQLPAAWPGKIPWSSAGPGISEPEWPSGPSLLRPAPARAPSGTIFLQRSCLVPPANPDESCPRDQSKFTLGGASADGILILLHESVLPGPVLGTLQTVSWCFQLTCGFEALPTGGSEARGGEKARSQRQPSAHLGRLGLVQVRHPSLSKPLTTQFGKQERWLAEDNSQGCQAEA